MLLNPVLAKYLSDLETAIRGLIDAYIERYEEEVITGDRISVRIRIRLANDPYWKSMRRLLRTVTVSGISAIVTTSKTVRTTSFLDTTTPPIFPYYPAILTTNTSPTKFMNLNHRTSWM